MICACCLDALSAIALLLQMHEEKCKQKNHRPCNFCGELLTAAAAMQHSKVCPKRNSATTAAASSAESAPAADAPLCQPCPESSLSDGDDGDLGNDDSSDSFDDDDEEDEEEIVDGSMGLSIASEEEVLGEGSDAHDDSSEDEADWARQRQKQRAAAAAAAAATDQSKSGGGAAASEIGRAHV